MPWSSKHERIAVFVFGAVFVVAMLALAIAFPEPTAFQYTVFRVVLALATAGVAAFIPGFIQLHLSTWLRAGGAIAVFVIVYFFSPAQLVYKPPIPKVGDELRFIVESVASSEGGGLDIYATAWNMHPYEKLRITSINIVELDKIETEFYCCPETRSELTLSLDVAEGKPGKADHPLMTTFEIPPLSSHSLLIRVSVVRGMADGDPVVWFGLKSSYSAPSRSLLVSRSDKLFLANAQRARMPTAFSKDEFETYVNSDLGRLNFLKLKTDAGRDWFVKPS